MLLFLVRVALISENINISFPHTNNTTEVFIVITN